MARNTTPAKPADAATPAEAPAAVEAAAPAAKPAPANCGCGCGAATITAKARFLSGHDARFAGAVGRGERVLTDADASLLTPALQAKIDKIRRTAEAAAKVKAAKEAAKKAADAAYAAALANA